MPVVDTVILMEDIRCRVRAEEMGKIDGAVILGYVRGSGDDFGKKNGTPCHC